MITINYILTGLFARGSPTHHLLNQVTYMRPSNYSWGRRFFFFNHHLFLIRVPRINMLRSLTFLLSPSSTMNLLETGNVLWQIDSLSGSIAFTFYQKKKKEEHKTYLYIFYDFLKSTNISNESAQSNTITHNLLKHVPYSLTHVAYLLRHAVYQLAHVAYLLKHVAYLSRQVASRARHVTYWRRMKLLKF